MAVFRGLDDQRVAARVKGAVGEAIAAEEVLGIFPADAVEKPARLVVAGARRQPALAELVGDRLGDLGQIDRVLARIGALEHLRGAPVVFKIVGVVAGAAVQLVAAGGGRRRDRGRRARAHRQGVVAGIAVEGVVARLVGQCVLAGAAAQQVVALAAVKLVVARLAVEPVVAGAADQAVVAAAAAQDVGATEADQQVGPGAAGQRFARCLVGEQRQPCGGAPAQLSVGQHAVDGGARDADEGLRVTGGAPVRNGGDLDRAANGIHHGNQGQIGRAGEGDVPGAGRRACARDCDGVGARAGEPKQAVQCVFDVLEDGRSGDRHERGARAGHCVSDVLEDAHRLDGRHGDETGRSTAQRQLESLQGAEGGSCERLNLDHRRRRRQTGAQARCRLAEVIHRHGAGVCAVIQQVLLAGGLRRGFRQSAGQCRKHVGRRWCRSGHLVGVVAQPAHDVGDAGGCDLVGLGDGGRGGARHLLGHHAHLAVCLQRELEIHRDGAEVQRAAVGHGRRGGCCRAGAVVPGVVDRQQERDIRVGRWRSEPAPMVEEGVGGLGRAADDRLDELDAVKDFGVAGELDAGGGAYMFERMQLDHQRGGHGAQVEGVGAGVLGLRQRVAVPLCGGLEDVAVVARAAGQGIGTRAAGQRVVAVTTVELVGPGGAGQRVLAHRAAQVDAGYRRTVRLESVVLGTANDELDVGEAADDGARHALARRYSVQRDGGGRAEAAATGVVGDAAGREVVAEAQDVVAAGLSCQRPRQRTAGTKDEHVGAGAALDAGDLVDRQEPGRRAAAERGDLDLVRAHHLDHQGHAEGRQVEHVGALAGGDGFDAGQRDRAHPAARLGHLDGAGAVGGAGLDRDGGGDAAQVHRVVAIPPLQVDGARGGVFERLQGEGVVAAQPADGQGVSHGRTDAGRA